MTHLTNYAQTSRVNLDNCLKWARDNYPEVKKYGIIEATEKCNLSNASKNWLPMISLQAQGGWTNSTADINDLIENAFPDNPTKTAQIGSYMYDANVKAVPNFQYHAGVEFQQAIYDGGVTSLQRKIARQEAEVDRARIEASLHSLDDRVIDTYFSILLLQERKTQAELRIALLNKNLDKLRKLQKEDMVKQNDVDALEVDKLKAQQSLDIILENLETYRATLTLLTGKKIGEQELEKPAMPVASRNAFSQTADMQLLNRQSELLNIKERMEKTKTLPKISFAGQVYYGFPGSNIFRNLVIQTPTLNIDLSLNVKWDISSFYTKKNNMHLIQLQRESIDNAREMLVYQQSITNTSLETKLKRLQNIRQQDDKIVELHERLRVAEEVKVDNDMVDATALLSKINDEADAKLQRSINETELMMDIYKLNLYGDTKY